VVEGRNLIGRLRRVNLVVADGVFAVALSVGGIADASAHVPHGLDALAVVSCVGVTATVAWRRLYPVMAIVVAGASMVVFQFASGYTGGGTIEVAAVVMDFYLLGRRAQPLVSSRVLAAFTCWLICATAILYGSESGSFFSRLAGGVAFVALMGGLPFALGRTLETWGELTRRLATTTALLEKEQEDGARRAAGEERSRMARELHDVIAHSVSVMVIQTSAARRVFDTDLQSARHALRTVEASGRDALVELRRIVGAMRRGPDDLAGSSVPGLSQLEVLVDRARAAGLGVELRLVGDRRTLPPGQDLVAFRVVQEALTNAIKHAPSARAQVTVGIDARQLALEVVNTASDRTPERNGDGSGHGLIGMSERVALFGGEVSAGTRADGGFRVHALIPLDGPALPVDSRLRSEHASAVDVSVADALPRRWFDPMLAGVLLVAFEIEVLVNGHRRGPLVLNLATVAVMALAAVARRRSPLWFLVVVGLLDWLLAFKLTAPQGMPLLGFYVVLVPTYAVAAWEERGKAVLGLAIFVLGAVFENVVLTHRSLTDLVGGTVTAAASWAAGWAIRRRRKLNAELKRVSATLVAEREHRARLAVAGERSRIARELHALVARAVTAMVIQSEAAQSLLAVDVRRADVAMRAIEETGREALVEMRRILGILRHPEHTGELTPQPGVDQVYALITRARDGGQPIELTVDGDPGVLPAGVDLGVYRIIEDALVAARRHDGGVAVALRFGEDELELDLTSRCEAPNAWPTPAMRERVALCGGELRVEMADQDNWRFVASMPRAAQGVFA
jgi:signal transduction histidine kinase